MKKNLWWLIFLVFASIETKAEEVTLPAEDKKIYATSETRKYDLKVKLKPKITDFKVFWKEVINWEEEIKHWRWEVDKDLPPEIQNRLGLNYKTNITLIPEGEFLKIVSTGPFVLTRDLDLDLEEYPLFDLEVEFENSEFSSFLGIDYNQDNLVDDYLKIEFSGEYNLLDLAREKCPEEVEEPKFKLKKIFLLFKPFQEGNFLCVLKDLNFYNLNSLVINDKFRYPYPLKEENKKSHFLKKIQEVNPGLVKIDETVFKLNDFTLPENFEDLERDVLVKRIELAKGKHKYERLENPTFEVEWVILEPVANKSASAPEPQSTNGEEPEIIFKKINPTKYLVKVEGAKGPFWLVFSESFHKQWRIYKYQKSNIKNQNYFEEIVADYPNLKVKEAKHLMKFTPQDIRFLFKKSLKAEHCLVNGYANGWYIEPEKLGLGENFVLVIYFWPQSLFYLGLFISGITFIFCIIYLIYDFVKKRKNVKI